MARSAAVKVRAIDTGRASPVVEAAVSAVDRVIDAVKSGIRNGHYVPGQRLAEPDMIREFHVSRGSVREALRRMEAEGLVQIELYRGAAIRKMSRNEFIEVNEIRELLEGLAAAHAARRMDETERRRLVALEQDWDRGASGLTFPEYNEKFHDLILDASRHSQLPLYIEQTQLLFFRLQFHRILREPSKVTRSRAEHARVAAAILKGDARSAERLMRDHVHKTGMEILSAPEEFFSN